MKHLKFVSFIGLLIAATTLFIGCNNEEEEPEPQSVLTADAGEDQAVNVGDEVTLDGTGSSDSEGNPFSYSWSFVSTPDGSTAALSDATSATPTFTPDVAGEYVIELTISNDTSEDTDQVTVTAEQDVEPLEIGGSITEATTLTDRFEDPLFPDYIASSNVNVSAVLTIDPGVCIIFEEDVLMNIQQGAAIIAEGTQTDSICFTSANIPGGINWKGIFINSASAQNSFAYTKLSYAGNSSMDFVGTNYNAGIGVNAGGNVKIENSKIYNNEGYGIYVDDGGGKLNTFANNVLMNNITGIGVPADEVDDIDSNTEFTGNTVADVEIQSTSLSETVETTWNALNGDANYRVTGDLTINGVVTINAGASFELDEDVMIRVNGALMANGQDGNMIKFTTSDEASALLWKGIYIPSADGRNSMDYVDLSYAGNSTMDFVGTNYSAGIGVDDGGKLSINNSIVSNNKGYGLYIDNDAGQLENFSANVFENNDRAIGLPADEADNLDGNTIFTNNTEAEVEIFATTYNATKASTWPSLNADAMYRVTGRLIIAGDLTIEAGAFFELDEDVIVEVTGSLVADGTAGDNITFTTSNPDGGLLWKGIYISSGSNLNSFNYVVLNNAGNSTMDFVGPNYPAGIGVDENGKITVTNSVISNNTGYGLYVDDGGGEIIEFSNNTFENNDQGVGIPADEADDMDGNTVFSGNTTADVEIFYTTYSDNKESTWQSLNNGATYRLRGDVDINGVLTIAPGATFEMDQNVEIEVFGALIAEGTTADNITFTTSNQAGGILWKGLFIQSADARNILDYVTVSYGGNSTLDFVGSNFKANVGVDDGAFLTITNSTITNSGGYGIYSKGTTNDFTDPAANNTFANNPEGNNYNP